MSVSAPVHPTRIISKSTGLAATVQLMAKTAEFQRALLGKPDSFFENQLHRLRLGIFTLVVMGEVKKGKSSFINALLGEPDLVPADNHVATSTVFKIYGGKKTTYTVHFLPEAKRPKKIITKSELADYGTETGNPGNTRMVDFIAVESPSLLLQDGLVIVDTPGVGGLFKEHRDITFRYAPRADAIFFVTDSVESPLGAEEVKFLRELRGITNMTYFVQTKTDAADESAAEKMRQNNLTILTGQAGYAADSLRYFLLSSKLKTLADAEKDLDLFKTSGFGQVVQFLEHDLRAKRDAKLAEKGCAQAQIRLTALGVELESKKQILSAATEEERDKLRTRYAECEAATKRFQSKEMETLLHEFQKAARGLRDAALMNLNRELRVGGELQREIQKQMEGLADAKAVYAGAPQWGEDIRSKSARTVLQRMKADGAKLEELLQQLVIQCGGRLAAATGDVLPDMRFESSESLQDLAAKAQVDDAFNFKRARSMTTNATIAVGMAGLAGAVIGSVIPVVGTVIGSTAGMAIAGMFGARQGYKEYTEATHAKAMAEVNARLAQVTQDCSLHAQKGVGDFFDAVVEDGVRRIKGFVEETRAAQVQKRQEIEAAAKLTKAECDKKKTALSELEAIHKRLCEEAGANG